MRALRPHRPDRVLDPGWTNFVKRTYYITFDLSGCLVRPTSDKTLRMDTTDTRPRHTAGGWRAKRARGHARHGLVGEAKPPAREGRQHQLDGLARRRPYTTIPPACLAM